MAKLFNRAKMDTSTTGSGTITLGSAVSGYQSFADAGVSNGDVVQYVIEDGANWEIGTGTYSATGTSLTRSPTESSSGGAAISLTGTASVFISAVADDLNRLQNAGSTKIEATASGVDVTGNVTVSGTVDGRDVAADGTKLDGIEAGADVTDTANVTSAGALMTTGGTMTGSLEAYGGATETIISVKTNTIGQSTFDGSGAGVQLIAGGMNTTSKYTPSLQFGSYDSNLSPIPKMLASVIGRATETYAASTDGGMALDFFTTSNDPGSGQQAVHAMTIDHDGQVGIGVTAPDSQLHVYGAGQTTANLSDSGNQGGFIRVSDNGSLAGSGGGVIFASTQSDDTGAVGMAAIKGLLSNGSGNTQGHLAFSTRASTTDTALTERMRLTYDGKVGIGTQSPSQKLTVSGGNIGVDGFVTTPEIRTYNGQQLVLSAGESYNYATGQTGENVYLNSEYGVQINSSPDNWASGWAGRHTTTIGKSDGSSSFGGGIDLAGNLDMGQNDIVNGDSIYMDNWYRSSGNTGWYNETYGGGINMTDTTYVRVYNSKAVRIDSTSNNSIWTKGGIRVDGSGGTRYISAGPNSTTDGSLYNNTGSGEYGAAMLSAGRIDIARWQNDCMRINRMGNDGALVYFYQAGSAEGSITVSGTTVSYNGGHLARWSRLADDTKDVSIVKGTVMTNLDEMVVWHHEAQPATYYVEGDELPEGKAVGDEKEPAREAYTEDNEQLNKMAVSSVEGDPNVAGVFVNWDDEDEYNDMNIAMTGDMVIRIAQGTTVARGDLLMSAGDGTAKPQGDDIVRSKTIAKVTSTNVSHTYDDGSYLVPCVLMAC